MLQRSWLLACSAGLLLCTCGPKTFNQRLAASEKLASEADDLLGRAEQAMAALEPDRAKRLLDDAREVLRKPDTSLYPEYEMMNDRLKGDDARLPEVVKAREKREIEQKVTERRKELAQTVERYQKAFARLVAKDLARADLEAFDAAAKELTEELKDDELVKKSAAWAAEVKDHRDLLEHGTARTGTARARVSFTEGPGAARLAVKPALQKVREAKEPADRAARQAEVVAKLEECVRGQQLIERTQVLTMSTVWLDGQELAPAAVVKACARDLPAAKQALAALQQETARVAAKRKADEERAAAKKKAEEAKEAARRKQEEAREAAREKQEEARRKKEQAKEAAREKQEEARRKKEEAKESARKKAEEAKAKAAEAQRKQAEEKEAARKKKEAAAAELAKARAEEAKAKAEEAKAKAEEAKAKAELAKAKAKDAKAKGDGAKPGKPRPGAKQN